MGDRQGNRANLGLLTTIFTQYRPHPDNTHIPWLRRGADPSVV